MKLEAALAYVRHGIPVLPVHTPGRGGSCSCGRSCGRAGKHPRLRHGLTEASADPQRIEAWWARWPDANIGLRTGIVMDVADIDSPAGRQGLRHLLGGTIPGGPQVRTGGGGWHFWFPPLGFGNRVALLPGVDWRGTGGYVLAPPSRHASGTTYHWVVRPGTQLPMATSALVRLIAGPEPPAPGPGPGHTSIAHPERYAAAILEAEAERVAQAPVGARNDTLNRAAFALGRLVGAGLTDETTATRELTAAAARAGLGRMETARTIRSGLTAGRRSPLRLEPGPGDRPGRSTASPARSPDAARGPEKDRTTREERGHDRVA